MVGDYRGSYSRPSSHSVDSDDASSMEEETTSSLYSAGKEYTPIEWTDEKHSLYLKSMEASFVDQLYNSLGSNLNKENVPDTGPSRMFGSNRKPSQEQFKVLRDGFWQKMNVKQSEYRLNGRRGSHEFLRSPWIKHYRTLPKTQSLVTYEGNSEPQSKVFISNAKKGIVISTSGSASSMKQILREGCTHSRDRDQISIGEAEVSDQNFVNEVTKGDCGSSKKMKTVLNVSSRTDQVVPLRKTPAT